MSTQPSKVAPARIAALLALSLCALLAPLQSMIWNGAETPAWVATLATALAPGLHDAEAASGMSAPPPDYFFFGRVFVLVYAGLLASLRLAPLCASRSAWLAPLLALAAAGDVIAYWVSPLAGPGVRAVGFWYIEVPALLAALVLTSAVGIGALRRGGLARPAAWMLAAATPLALLATAAIRYMPHGLVLPIALALAVHALAAAPAPSRAVALEGGRA